MGAFLISIDEKGTSGISVVDTRRNHEKIEKYSIITL
jgi:hypothetical protein